MRNTYDHKGPQRGASQEGKESQTYTNAKQKNFSFQKHSHVSNNQNTSQKMTKFIIETLKKITTAGSRYSVATTLKPNQKTLLTTISHLLSSFDGKFDQQSLSVDMLIQLFKALGYPNNINKTFFQPVGAPHTWNQCLAMMQWLAELAAYHYEMRAHLEQGEFDEDFNSLLIRSYIEKQPQLPEKYLVHQIEKKSKQIEEYQYSIKSKHLAIDNLKTAQKDLTQMDEEERRLNNILFREKQQVIHIDQQNSRMIQKIEELEQMIQEQKRVSKYHDRQIQILNNQIQTQQLSVEEVDKIKMNIKEYHDKIVLLKKNHKKEIQHIDKTNVNIIEEYTEFYNVLEEMNELIKRNKQQIQKRNTYLDVPQCDRNSFINYLKSKEEGSHMKIQQLLGTRQIRELVHNCQLLSAYLDNQLKNNEGTKERYIADSRSLNDEILSKQKVEKSLKTQLNQITYKFEQTQKSHQQLKQEYEKLQKSIDEIVNEIHSRKRENEDSLNELEQINQQIKKLTQFKKLYTEKSQQVISHMKKSQEDFQIAILQSMEQHYQQFYYANSQFSLVPRLSVNMNQNEELQNK